jgi:hypothetical protein
VIIPWGGGYVKHAPVSEGILPRVNNVTIWSITFVDDVMGWYPVIIPSI